MKLHNWIYGASMCCCGAALISIALAGVWGYYVLLGHGVGLWVAGIIIEKRSRQ